MGIGLNFFLLNTFVVIHPVGVFVLLLNFLYINIRYATYVQKYYVYGILLNWSCFSLLTGGMWAYSEGTWGGFWAWDYSECVNLNIMLCIILLWHNIYNYLEHLYFFKQHICVVIIIIIYTYTKFFFLNSSHNFDNIFMLYPHKINLQLIAYIFIINTYLQILQHIINFFHVKILLWRHVLNLLLMIYMVFYLSLTPQLWIYAYVWYIIIYSCLSKIIQINNFKMLNNFFFTLTYIIYINFIIINQYCNMWIINIHWTFLSICVCYTLQAHYNVVLENIIFFYCPLYYQLIWVIKVEDLNFNYTLISLSTVVNAYLLVFNVLLTQKINLLLQWYNIINYEIIFFFFLIKVILMCVLMFFTLINNRIYNNIKFHHCNLFMLRKWKFYIIKLFPKWVYFVYLNSLINFKFTVHSYTSYTKCLFLITTIQRNKYFNHLHTRQSPFKWVFLNIKYLLYLLTTVFIYNYAHQYNNEIFLYNWLTLYMINLYHPTQTILISNKL